MLSLTTPPPSDICHWHRRNTCSMYLVSERILTRFNIILRLPCSKSCKHQLLQPRISLRGRTQSYLRRSPPTTACIFAFLAATSYLYRYRPRQATPRAVCMSCRPATCRLRFTRRSPQMHGFPALHPKAWLVDDPDRRRVVCDSKACCSVGDST